MKSVLALLLGISVANAASAQIVDRETVRSADHVAALGDIIWEKARYRGAPGVRIAEPIRQEFAFGQVVNLAPNATLMVFREKKLKACEKKVVYTLGGYRSGGWLNCLIDKDDDGRFEAVAVNELSGARPIARPVPYVREMVPIGGVGEGSFKQTLTYLGKSGGDLRISYREFADDLARPAFTEDLTLPAPTEFPQTMRLKSILVEVIAINSDGLHYRLK